MNTKDAMQSAAGLCWSEHHRWKTADPKTGAHWKEVAEALEAATFDLVFKHALETTKEQREREKAGEIVDANVLNQVLR